MQWFPSNNIETCPCVLQDIGPLGPLPCSHSNFTQSLPAGYRVPLTMCDPWMTSFSLSLFSFCLPHYQPSIVKANIPGHFPPVHLFFSCQHVKKNVCYEWPLPLLDLDEYPSSRENRSIAQVYINHLFRLSSLQTQGLSFDACGLWNNQLPTLSLCCNFISFTPQLCDRLRRVFF